MRWKDLPYTVDEWSYDGGKIEREVVKACNFDIAKAAYEVAVRIYPNAKLTLRDGARVIRRNYEKEFER